MKGKKGASLITNIITVALGTIIATAVLGEDGLIQSAQKATEAYKIAEYQEKIGSIATGEYINAFVEKDEINVKNIEKELKQQKWVNDVIINDDETLTIDTEDYKLEVKIEDDGSVTIYNAY